MRKDNQCGVKQERGIVSHGTERRDDIVWSKGWFDIEHEGGIVSHRTGVQECICMEQEEGMVCSACSMEQEGVLCYTELEGGVDGGVIQNSKDCGTGGRDCNCLEQKGIVM